MAQTIMSVILQRPNDARARPSSLIKDDAIYGQIFNDGFPVKVYVVSGEMKKRVDSRLREKSDLSSADRNNVSYHVLTRLAARISNKAKPSVEDMAKVDLASITESAIDGALSEVLPIYNELGSTGSVAKGREFAAKVRDLPI